MPDPVGTYNDGGVIIIEQTVSLLTDDGTHTDYILKKCSLKGGSTELNSTDANGKVVKSRYVKDKVKGSGTLQLLVATDKPPAWPQPFTATDQYGTDQGYVLIGVGQEFGTNEEVFLPVDIAKKLN